MDAGQRHRRTLVAAGLLADFLPGTRVVYMHRGLEATARSAKAWGETVDEAGMHHFCAQWLALKRAEWAEWHAHVSDWERQRYADA